MQNNLLFILDLENRSLFSNSIRSFFGFISKYVYKLFSGAIDLMYQLATFDFGMNEFIETISSRLFGILIIFMIFKVTISIMSYLVNPDVAIDKDKGFQGIIKRVIISIILLISINPIFIVLKNVESAILEDDIITTLFTTSEDEKVITAGKERIVGIRMSPHCPSNKMIYTATKGDRIALLLFRPFLQPYDEDDITDDKVNNGQTAWDTVFSPDEGADMAHYCGYDISNVKEIVLEMSGTDFKKSFRKSIPGPNSAEGLLRDYYYNLGINEADTGYSSNGDGGTSQYFFEFDYFFAFIVGIVGLLIIISFCFDVIMRSLNFIILQLIAPIPIISYVSPQGKSSEMLSAWWKKVISVWASLFIRILCLSLAVLIIDGACNSLDNDDFGNASLLMQIFVILGTLMFAKKLPKLLEEIIPGLKLDGGFELNPFKRIRNDALFGKQISNAAMGALGLGAAGIGAGLSHLGAVAYDKHKMRQQQKGIDNINKNANNRKMQAMQRMKAAGANLNVAKARAAETKKLEFNKAKKEVADISRAIAYYKNPQNMKITRNENETDEEFLARKSSLEKARKDKITELNKQRDDIENKYFGITRPQLEKEMAEEIKKAEENYNTKKINAKTAGNLTEQERIKIKEHEEKIQDYKNKKIHSQPIRSAVEEVIGGMAYGAKNAIKVDTTSISKAISEGLRGSDKAAIKRNYREDFSIGDEIFDKFTTFSRIKNDSGTSSEISKAIKSLNNQLTREQNNMVTLSNTLANLTNSLENSKKPEAINIINNINHEEFINRYNSYNDYRAQNSNTNLTKEDFDAIYSAINASVKSQKMIDNYSKDIKKYTEMKDKQEKKDK